MLPKLGIIAGNGLLPSELTNIYTKQGGLCHLIALSGQCDIELIKNFQHEVFYIGNAGAIIDYCYKHEIQDIIFVGGINRPDLKSIKLDFTGSILMAKIIKQKILGDDNILRIIANFFEEKGFNVISAKNILSMNYGDKDNISLLTNKAPSYSDNNDIQLGIKVVTNLGALDIGQSAIVERVYVLGVEAAEGTDNLIERCAILRKQSSGGVLVKMMKPSQDSRMDIPVIGPNTIEIMAKLKYNGIALQKEGVIIVKQEDTVALANKYGIFIIKI